MVIVDTIHSEQHLNAQPGHPSFYGGLKPGALQITILQTLTSTYKKTWIDSSPLTTTITRLRAGRSMMGSYARIPRHKAFWFHFLILSMRLPMTWKSRVRQSKAYVLIIPSFSLAVTIPTKFPSLGCFHYSNNAYVPMISHYSGSAFSYRL